MSKLTYLAALTAVLLSHFTIGAASAGAVTWDNSGDTHFSATGGAGTLSSTAVGLACSGSDVTGRTTAPVAGAVAQVFDATATYTNCLVAGQLMGWSCGLNFTASGSVAGGVTGDLDITCRTYLGGVQACHIDGRVHAEYANPIPPSLVSVLTTTTGGSFRWTNGLTNCPYGNNDAAHLSVLTFNVVAGTGGPSPHLGPSFTRTA